MFVLSLDSFQSEDELIVAFMEEAIQPIVRLHLRREARQTPRVQGHILDHGPLKQATALHRDTLDPCQTNKEEDVALCTSTE